MKTLNHSSWPLLAVVVLIWGVAPFGHAQDSATDKEGVTVRIVVEGVGDQAVPRVVTSVPAESKVGASVGPTTFGSAAAQAMGPSLKYGQSFQDYGPKTLPSGP